jgi:hypothetical protein
VVTVTTYNNGSQVETKDVVTNLLGIESSLVDASGNTTVGFITTADFDEVRITYTTLVGVLFSGQVYYPVIENSVQVQPWYVIPRQMFQSFLSSQYRCYTNRHHRRCLFGMFGS